LIIGLCVAFGTLIGLLLYLPGIRPEPVTVRTVSGTPAIGGAFALIDQNGKTVTDADLKGRYALVFFGFTNCPDVCPLTLQNITQALEIAGPLGENVVPLFISVDPARDTPDAMRDYIANFHPRFVALTGTPEAAKQAADVYRVYFKKAAAAQKEGGDPSDYMMEHSGFVYFMGRDGAYITHFGPQTTSQEMAARIRQETSPTK
jgi:protein SCO1/2